MKKLNFILSVIFCGFFSYGTHAQAKVVAPSRDATLKKYALDQLDSAANLLRVDIDRALDKNKPQFCAIKFNDAKNMTMPLKDLVDAKTKLFLDTNKGKSISLGFKNQDCDNECHCGLYATVLETAQQRGMTLADADLKYLDMAQTKGSTQGTYQAVACAYRSKWFCASPLLKYLKANATK